MVEIFIHDKDSTELDFEEKQDLLLSYITTHDELNEAEQFNILKARVWALKGEKNVLDELFLKKLHRRMFCDVWRWAGKYRKTEKNIGIEPYKISIELNSLISDVQFWLENNTFAIEEIAARFHHKLVWIHPFVNGNGRFSRLVTDIFLKSHDNVGFSWGEKLGEMSERRKAYISALRNADNHDIQPLLRFLKGDFYEN